MAASTPGEGTWLSPLRMSGVDVDGGSDDEMDGKPPVHPVPTMQGAFEESMKETLNETDEPDPSDRYSTADSISRRKMLLEQEEYERTVAGRWKQKPGEKFHPLWKLVAQISFGMHLLQQGLAKSDEEVIKILQTHVDDVDGFLERTTEDFDLAQGDINERIRYLRLPLEHGDVFDGMLNDRHFRIAIVEGNEKIEHIIDRTSAAMTDALKDVQKGLDATRELAKYLTRVDKRWDDRSEEHDSVYLAMIGNTEGWTRAFLTLQSKGSTLRKALVQLGGIVAEMQKRAGAASRKNLVPVKAINGRYYVEIPSTSIPHSSTPPKSPHKPLPETPDSTLRPLGTQKPTKLKVRTSGKSSKHKEPASPFIEQAMAAKRMEPVMRVTSSERSTPIKSPSSAPSAKGTESVSSAKGIEPLPSAKGMESSPSYKGVEPASSSKGVELISPVKGTKSTPSVKHIESKPVEIGIESAPPAKATETAPPIPPRSLSRRTSLSERRKSLTRKLSFFKDSNPNENNAPKDQASIENRLNREAPAKSLIRRLSSRKIVATSVSVYSTSPTSPTKRIESPVPREASPPVVSPSGEPVPPQSSYGSISFLPMHPLISPIRDTFPTEPEAPSDSYNRSQSHLQSHPQSDYNAPLALQNQTEGDDSAIHPLLRRNNERGTELSPPLMTAFPNENGKSSDTSHPIAKGSNEDVESTGYMPHPFLVTAREFRDNKITSSRRLDDNGSKGTKEDTPRSPVKDGSKNSKNISQPPLNEKDDDLEADIRSHHLLLAAMNRSETSLHDPDPIIPPPRAEVKEPASPSHPLLLEDRHQVFATKLPPLKPPRNPGRDLPLRHYRSHENLQTNDLSDSLQDVVKTSHKRSSSLYQRGSRQLSSSTTPPPLPTNSAHAPAHSSAKPSPLHLITLPPNNTHEASNFSQPPQPTVASNPFPELSDTSKGAAPPIDTSRPLNLQIAKGFNDPSTETKVAAPTENNVSTSASHHDRKSDSPTSEPSPTTKYKTSATNNAPFYLNPASSADLIEFLASTPPPSPPNPYITQTFLSANDTTSPTVQRDYLSEPISVPIPPPPPPPPSGSPPGSNSRSTPVKFAPEGPKVIATSPATEKKISGWKKVFGVGSGASAPKKTKVAKGVLVIGEPKAIVVQKMDRKEKSKSKIKRGGESWEVGRKKDGHRKSHSGGHKHDANGGDEGKNGNGNGNAAEAEGTFMGVGKDGVWISRKNFVKT